MYALARLFIFLSIFNNLIGMNESKVEKLMESLLPELQHKIFEIQLHQAPFICEYSAWSQAELIRYIVTVSRINKHYHAYINSSEFVQRLFTALPYNIRYPLACCFVFKSFQKSFDGLKQFAEKISVETEEEPTAVEWYLEPSVSLCVRVLQLDISQIQGCLEDGADPNFYADQGHIGSNCPPALVTLAGDCSDESIKKIKLLLLHGADVDIEPHMPFNSRGNGSWNYCICNTPTPLAVAMAYENEAAVSVILQYNPKKLFFNEAFLSKIPAIKEYVLSHVAVTPNDLTKGLSCALLTQNMDDVQGLLERGADPHKGLDKTIERTINYCFHPERYVDYADLSHIVGTRNFRGHDFEKSAIPIPDTHVVEELCKYGAYNEDTLNQLKKLQLKVHTMIGLLEANKPQ